MALVPGPAARISAIALGLLVAVAPLATMPQGPGEVSTVTPFKAKLIQKNRDQPIFVVTSDGDRFTEARLVRSEKSPMLIRYEVACDDGFTDPFSGAVHSDGLLKDIMIWTNGWAASLPSLDADWTYALDLYFDMLNNEAIKGNFNLVDQGVDAAKVRKRLNDLKPKVIEACNQALEAKMRQGFPRKTALTQIGLIDPMPSVAPEMLPAVLRATCQKEVFRPREDEDNEASHSTVVDQVTVPALNMKLPVLCESPFETPRPASDDLTQTLGVQEIEFAPGQNPYKGACPLTVKFSGHVRMSGSGQLRYRYRTGSGALGAPVTVQVKDGRKPVPLSLSIEVGRPSSGPGFKTPPEEEDEGLTLTVPLPDPDPRGPTLAGGRKPRPPGQAATGYAAPAAPGQITDWVRLEVLSPTQGMRRSDEVFYKAICEPTTVAGGGRVTPPRDPDTPRRGIRTTPASPEEPGREERGGRRTNPATRSDAAEPRQFELQVLATDLNPSMSRGLGAGRARLTLTAGGGGLRGTLTQGRTVVSGVPFAMEGCRQGALERWRGSARARLVRRGSGRAAPIEIRVRHPEVDDCVLVGMLSGDAR